MTKEIAGNHIRAHRRRHGLTQHELGILVGYEYGNAVGRHERSSSEPPLLVALAYEIVFEIPVAQLFPGFRSAVSQAVARNLEELKARFETQSSNGRKSIFEKRQWIASKNIL